MTGEWRAVDEGRHDVAGVEQWRLRVRDERAASRARSRSRSSTAEGRASFLFDGVLASFGRIVVADEAVPLPRPTAGLEIRADGLWASLLCETAFEHWSLGLEAFGLRLDDDAVGDDPPAWADLVGERLPVGFDLEWELSEPPVAARRRPRLPAGGDHVRRPARGAGPARGRGAVLHAEHAWG